MIKSIFVIYLFFLFSCTQHHEKGSEKNPIIVSLIPSKEAGSLLTAGGALEKWLAEQTGYSFSVNVPNSYVAVVEALGSKRADIAFLTTSSYALAFKKYNVEARFISLNPSGGSNYRGQFIVRSDSKIKKLEDIQGKKIAYVDPSSASGYLLPAYLLKLKKIKPSEEVFAGKHDAVVTMVYQGQVEVGATFYSPPENNELKDARRLVKTQFPDVAEKIKILDFTKELPNDALVFRRDLDGEIKARVAKALEEWVKTSEGKKNLRELNNGVGLKAVNDADYEEARKLIYEMEAQIK